MYGTRSYGAGPFMGRGEGGGVQNFNKAMYVRRLKMRVLAPAHGQIVKDSLGWGPLT